MTYYWFYFQSASVLVDQITVAYPVSNLESVVKKQSYLCAVCLTNLI